MTPFDLDLQARTGKKKQEVQVFGEGTYVYKIRYRKYNTQEYIDLTGYITILQSHQLQVGHSSEIVEV